MPELGARGLGSPGREGVGVITITPAELADRARATSRCHITADEAATFLLELGRARHRLRIVARAVEADPHGPGDVLGLGDRTSQEPFTGLTCHDLRHTAASLMRQAGIPAELVAERLGHADGGALLLRTYRHVRAGETRAAFDAIGPGLRAAALTDDHTAIAMANPQY